MPTNYGSVEDLINKFNKLMYSANSRDNKTVYYLHDLLVTDRWSRPYTHEYFQVHSGKILIEK